jgi:hypothetical protein
MTPFWTARSLPIPTALQSPELPFSSTNLLREGEKKTADSVCVSIQTSKKFGSNKKARVWRFFAQSLSGKFCSGTVVQELRNSEDNVPPIYIKS